MAVAQIVKWARPTYSGHAYSEVYRSASQLADTDTATVLAGATKKGETASNVWADAEVSRGDTWWYYIRHVNTLGAAGAFTEKSATVEVLGDLASQDTINNDDWSGADLAVANGGTGASSQSGARTNLGLGTAAVKNTGSSGNAVPLLDQPATFSNAEISLTAIPEYADDAAAGSGGLGAGRVYRTSTGEVRIKI